MTSKEIGELRRRQRRDRSNAKTIYGCYVNDSKEIVSEFTRSLATMTENEADKFFALLRRVLGGARGDILGRNLHLLNFRTQQVADSPEHKQLMALRGDGLSDEETRTTFFKQIIASLDLETHYLILLCAEIYDVPFKSKDDSVQADNSAESFSYVLCAVCPVKQTKPVLHYNPDDKEFQDGNIVNAASAPELGFLFPAFTDRATDIYNSLYYNRNKTNNHEAFVSAVFNTPVPEATQTQKDSFAEVVAEALENECSLDVVQTMRDNIRLQMAMHKEAKVPEALMLSREQLTSVLQDCGVSQDGLDKFATNFESTFGKDATLCPENIVNPMKYEVKTPDVTIRVAADRSDLIQTRTINGIRYILIQADSDVKVDGIPVKFAEEKAE